MRECEIGRLGGRFFGGGGRGERFSPKTRIYFEDAIFNIQHPISNIQGAAGRRRGGAKAETCPVLRDAPACFSRSLGRAASSRTCGTSAACPAHAGHDEEKKGFEGVHAQHEPFELARKLSERFFPTLVPHGRDTSRTPRRGVPTFCRSYERRPQCPPVPSRTRGTGCEGPCWFWPARSFFCGWLQLVFHVPKVETHRPARAGRPRHVPLARDMTKKRGARKCVREGRNAFDLSARSSLFFTFPR